MTLLDHPGVRDVAPTPVELIPRKQRRALHGIAESGPALLPLQAGQQYRFSFDMGACIGCHSCEVACAEQNGLPPEVAWRRVGEIEGGAHPETKRFHLSMACNHCLEPTCLQGCPTEAYVKLDSGIVAHIADDCIGCQYCTWNCPYSVPQFQPDRRIVTKCDMCRPRLETGLTSACVDACPTHAIGIEIVDVAAWRDDHRDADAPQLPSSDLTVSTTRIIVPPDMPVETAAGSDWSLRPEHAHWPLVWVTLLTQLATGLLVALLIASFSEPTHTIGRVAALAAAVVALPTALFHLGRPLLAWKALRGLRRSWLSREVLAFGLLAGAAGIATVFPSRLTASAATAVGCAAIFSSARLYMVPGRPSWDTPWTVASFAASAVALGPPSLLVLDAIVGEVPLTHWPLVVAGCVGVAASVGAQTLNIVRLTRHTEIVYRGTWVLLRDPLRLWTVNRVALAIAAFGLLAAGQWWVALACAIAGEVVGRYLFFVSVVPRSMPGAFFRGRV